MDPKRFEKKYQNIGGLGKLTELRSLFFSRKYIAGVFGVSPERVKQWMIAFFGVAYDPREDRREAIVSSMIEFSRNNSYPVFRFTYRNTPYYKEALSRCRKLKIYEQRKRKEIQDSNHR